MRILHSYLFFSIKYAGGTSDLMFKILKAQAKVGTRPVLLTVTTCSMKRYSTSCLALN